MALSATLPRSSRRPGATWFGRRVRYGQRPGGNIDTRSVDDLVAAAAARIDRLTPEQARAEIKAGAIVVDTRCAEDRRREGVIPESVHHPRTVLEWRADPNSEHRDPAIADYRARLIIVCNDGYSSILAAGNLAYMGFSRAAHLEGGFRAWKAAGLPVRSAD